MRIMFIAPRFHTNQVPIVKGLIKKGHTVEFVVSHLNTLEYYGDIIPKKVKPSLITRILYWFKNNKNEVTANDWYIKKFKPSLLSLYKIMRDFKPDILIVRERSIFSMRGHLISKLINTKVSLLYNQAPLVEKTNISRTKRILLPFLFPKVRYTPVKYVDGSNGNNKTIELQNSYFVPFVQMSEKIKKNTNDKINILLVGKYRKYKNMEILVEAVAKLSKADLDKVSFTIVGQCTNVQEEKYKNNIIMNTKEHNIYNSFNFVENVDYYKMNQHYLKSDIFILTSKKEYASISVLEAMKYGCAILSTKNNGTSFYVKEAKSGYLFDPNNANEISSLISELINDSEKLKKLKNNSLKYVESHLEFNIYYEKFKHMIWKEFDVNIDE